MVIPLPGRGQPKSLLDSVSLVQLTDLLHRQVALYSTVIDPEIGCFGRLGCPEHPISGKSATDY